MPEQPLDVEAVRRCADGAWAWVLEQVRYEPDGAWVPLTVPVSGDVPSTPPPDRDCLYDGVAGLAPVLAEIRLAREWTTAEQALADAVVARLSEAGNDDDCSLYVGLAGRLAAVALLDPGATDPLLDRLADRARPDGWPTPVFGAPSTPVNDLVLGNAGIVLTCAWLGGSRADRLTEVGAEAALAAATPAAGGLSWSMYAGDRPRVMPNYSHGTAGVATALAVAGWRLGRPDLVEAARRGAEHIVGMADMTGDGFRLPLQVPPVGGDTEPYAYGWCHGPTGTARMFGALQLAGVSEFAGRSCGEWVERAARSVRSSGLPARLRPGFWDNNGRCCGTAGVLDATLDLAQAGDPSAMEFADLVVGALLDRAEPSPQHPRHCYWRFREHRSDPPDLDPGVGWMQGAAGIAAALHRYVRVREHGRSAARVGLPDDWWSGPLTPVPA